MPVSSRKPPRHFIGATERMRIADRSITELASQRQQDDCERPYSFHLHHLSACRGRNVLIDPEQIGRVVLALHDGELVVVRAVGRLQPALDFIVAS